MLKKLAGKGNLITVVLGGVLAALWLLHLIFSGGEDKMTILILTPILAGVIYGFVRLLFKIIRMNAPTKFINFMMWFFLIGGALGILMTVLRFINSFPNGLSPSGGGCMGLIAAVLSEAKK